MLDGDLTQSVMLAPKVRSSLKLTYIFVHSTIIHTHTHTQGKTALLYAVKHGQASDESLLLLLLEHGADINAMDLQVVRVKDLGFRVLGLGFRV
jgi:hypothetical protein